MDPASSMIGAHLKNAAANADVVRVLLDYAAYA